MVLLVLMAAVVVSAMVALWFRWYQVEWRGWQQRGEVPTQARAPAFNLSASCDQHHLTFNQLYPKLDLSLKPPLPSHQSGQKVLIQPSLNPAGTCSLISVS